MNRENKIESTVNDLDMYNLCLHVKLVFYSGVCLSKL